MSRTEPNLCLADYEDEQASPPWFTLTPGFLEPQVRVVTLFPEAATVPERLFGPLDSPTWTFLAICLASLIIVVIAAYNVYSRCSK